MVYFIGVIIAGLIWGSISHAVGKHKNINGFWWGFWLGFIGLIVVILKKNNYVEEEYFLSKNTSEQSEYNELEVLSNLKNSGFITEEKFEEEKSKLLK